MKLAILTAAIVALSCGAAGAQTSVGMTPKTTVICLDISGTRRPSLCDVPGSRIDKREYYCRCGGEAMPADVAVCPDGVKAPAESLDLDRARRAAVKNFSLIGATYKGQPLCVDGRDPLTGR